MLFLQVDWRRLGTMAQSIHALMADLLMLRWTAWLLIARCTRIKLPAELPAFGIAAAS